ncbi:hypothetical protein O7622_05605 [Micromonospora sp. WMMD1076]|uniref:hypothetical protein n=1 Tax=Micromonospora sp. WMMD1076 TaxID=3016103 RepID=UPI002499C25B|nr:hypothetical protein [Micromonospora sp. WMMD1076]WFF08049.1 hypothetical protein O7622_05605 [Micromonospora sp. WMMD1076]
MSRWVELSTLLEFLVPQQQRTRPPRRRRKQADEGEQNSIMRHWLAQLGPAAVLAALGYIFHALLAIVYRSFYAQLGVSAAEVGHDSSSFASNPVAFNGLAVGLVIALLLPAVSGFLSVHGLQHTARFDRAVTLACVAPALLAAVAAMFDERLLSLIIALAALSAAAGVTIRLGYAFGPYLMPVPCLAVLVSLLSVRLLHTVLRGPALGAAAVVVVSILSVGIIVVQRRTTRTSRPLSGPSPLRWPGGLAQQMAITSAAILLLVLVGIGDLLRLDAAATRAAEQVRTYGYITDLPDELDLIVRPVTVRLLTDKDPLGLCSTSNPVALTQLNRTPGDALVLVRRLTPGSLTPATDRELVIIRLPAAQYLVVQHLALWTPLKTNATRSAGPPKPWALSACAPDQ